VKVLITADLHIHPHKNSTDRLYDGIKVLEWINETAIENGCRYIICVGDLFQDRQKIYVLTYQKVFECFKKYSSMTSWKLLLGNHDLWFAEKWDISSVYPLSALPNVEVISKPCSQEIDGQWFDWLPFVKNPLKAIECFPPEKRVGHVLCAHIAVDGAVQGTCHHTSDVSVEFEGDMTKVTPDSFGGWKYVFLGHYHTAQFLDERMQYVGSPYQINFNEAGHTPRVVILDTATMTLDYKENTFSPRHLIVDESKLGEVDVVNNFVQVRGDLTKFDAFEIQRSIADGQVRGLEFRAASLKTEIGSGNVKEKFDLAEGRTLERYVDAVGESGLDRANLIQLALEIVDESRQK